MKRFLLGLVGVLLLLAGLAGAGLGGWVLSVFGTDGRYEMPIATVQTPTAALYVNLFHVSSDASIPDGLLDTYVQATGSSKPVFLGVGTAEDVQDYLLGVPYEAASELTNGTFTTLPVPGTIVPAPDPVKAEIWQASVAGQDPRLLWTGQNGAGVFVVMNADGSAGVDTRLVGTLESPRLVPVVAGTMAVSLVFAIVGVVAIARAARPKRSTAHG